MSLRKWEPSPNDATSFAAFRWFANAIENDSLELYATNRSTYPEIERVLRNVMKELADLRGKFALPPTEECPDGWILCRNVCAPSCDLVDEAAPAPEYHE